MGWKMKGHDSFRSYLNNYSLFLSFWPQLCYCGFFEFGLNGSVSSYLPCYECFFQQLVRDGALRSSVSLTWPFHRGN